MTTALAAISSHCFTESIGNSQMTMMSNDDMNVLYQGLLDEDGSRIGEEDGCIDDKNGAVDDDKLEELMARQEPAYEREEPSHVIDEHC
jgi:hypothetical protein